MLESAHVSRDSFNSSRRRRSRECFTTPIVGRENEVAALVEAYNLASTAVGPEIVTVSGSAGIGKTAIVSQGLKKYVVEEQGGYFLEGCCQPSSVSQLPYAALMDVFGMLVDQVVEDGGASEVKSFLDSALGTDHSVLLQFLPSAEQILGPQSRPTRQPSHDWACMEEWAYGRLKISLRMFLRSVCTPVKPLVLFLDAIHCACPETLEIIRCLLEDKEMDGLLFVGAYRHDVPSKHLRETLTLLEDLKGGVTKVHLEPLAVGHIRGLVRERIGSNPLITKSTVSNVVYRKAQGNPFYSLVLLRMLDDEGDDAVWETVVDGLAGPELLKRRFRMLSDSCLQVLQVAAMLGPVFEVALIQHLTETENLETRIQNAVALGILRQADDPSVCEFSHPIYLEVLHDMLPAGSENRVAIHHQIGTFLWNLDSNEDLLFLTTSHLNQARSKLNLREDGVKVAGLNAQTAEVAMLRCNYRVAANLLEVGCSLLQEGGGNVWSHHYRLQATLVLLRARAAFALGNYAEADDYVSEFLKHGKTLDDRIPAFFTRIEILAAQRRLREGCNIGLAAVAEMGHPIIRKKKVGIVIELLRLKRRFKKETERSLLRRPRVCDPHKIALAKMVSNLTMVAWLCADVDLLIQLCFSSVWIVLKNGITAYSAHAITLFGFLLGSTLDFNESYRCAALSEKLLEGYEDSEGFLRARLISHAFLMHLRHLVTDSLGEFRSIFDQGMRTGDTSYASLSYNTLATIAFHTGQPLESLLETFKVMNAQSTVFGFDVSNDLQVVYHQAAINLHTNPREPLRLTGEIMNETEMIKFALEHNVVMMSNVIWFLRLTLGVVLGDWGVAEENFMHIWNRPGSNVDGSCHYVVPLHLYMGITGFQIAQTTTSGPTRRKWVARACKSLNLAQTWVKKGNPNMEHVLLFLQAERSAYNCDSSAFVKEAYDKAIAAAGEVSIRSAAALANERAARFFMAREDTGWATHYMRKAYALYESWQATTKCDQLSRQYGSLLGAARDDSSNSTGRGARPGHHMAETPVSARSLGSAGAGAEAIALSQVTPIG